MQSKRSDNKSEARIQSEIMLALSDAGCLIWRNETAGVWVGRVIHQESASLTLAGARMIQAGLCVGGADLIGVAPDGRFLAVEVKSQSGRPSKDQLNFIAAVQQAGGIAGVCRSVEEALKLLGD